MEVERRGEGAVRKMKGDRRGGVQEDGGREKRGRYCKEDEGR